VEKKLGIGVAGVQSALNHDGGSGVPAEEVQGDPHRTTGARGSRQDQTSMTWRPLYTPHTLHAACGNLADLHCGQATVATAVAFHCARRDRVLLRDVLRLGTATALYS
jgi:hypothetical protein